MENTNIITMNLQDLIDNNRLFAIEIKNEILNRLPRNIEISKFEIEEVSKLANNDSEEVWMKLWFTKDGKRFLGTETLYGYATFVNMNQNLELMVKGAIESITRNYPNG